ncbi:hypothetical protein [Blautia sp. 1033sp1_1033st1_G9_1033SCRN_220408]
MDKISYKNQPVLKKYDILKIENRKAQEGSKAGRSAEHINHDCLYKISPI